MIARTVARRTVMVGCVLGSAALTGCASLDLTPRTVVDPQSADRLRLTRARDLSDELIAQVDATITHDARLAPVLAPVRAIHQSQANQFARSAGIGTASPTTASAPITLQVLGNHERTVAHELQSLALAAEGGEVAALLGSAAAGLGQLLARWPR